MFFFFFFIVVSCLNVPHDYTTQFIIDDVQNTRPPNHKKVLKLMAVTGAQMLRQQISTKVWPQWILISIN